jgi:tRNA A-37 threonylcarbamoyl transferase component Bud32
MIGQILNNRYQVTALVGEGAMGEVYRATDTQTGQEVAVKVITQKLALDAEMLARFRREGEALRHLRHANIVAYVDMFPHGKQQVIVMEYVPGGSLAHLIQRGPLPVDQAVRVALELSDALAQAHHLNIIHRDIKPDNVLMAEDGRPKLTDFGVARLVSGTAKLTGTGMQMGTPYYMSPEAWEGRELNEQTDIWSLGVVLFEMLVGKVPFSGDTLVTVMNRVLTSSPPDIRQLRADAPPSLVRIIQRMLTRDRSERYASMREVALDLERAAKGGSKSAEGTRSKEAGTRLKEAAARKTVMEQEPKAAGMPMGRTALTVIVVVGLILIAGLCAGGGVGLWMYNNASGSLRATQTALMANLLRATSTQPPTATLPSATPRPSDTPLPPSPTETPLPPSPTPAPSLTPTPEPAQALPTATRKPQPKPPAATARPANAACTIQAIFGVDVYKDSPGLQIWEGGMPWGDSRLTCGNQVFVTSRPNPQPLPLPAGCSLFGEGIGVGPGGDWWAAAGYTGPASLGVNCSGVIRESEFVIEIVGGGAKPYGYGAAILVPPQLSGESPAVAASPMLPLFSFTAALLLALALLKLGRARVNPGAAGQRVAEAASRVLVHAGRLAGWARLAQKMLGLL